MGRDVGSVLEGCRVVRKVSPRINCKCRQMIFNPHRHAFISEESDAAKSSKSRDVCKALCHTTSRYAHKIICPAKNYLQLSRDCNVSTKRPQSKACHQPASHSYAFRMPSVRHCVQNILTHSSISALSQISPTPNH